MNYKPKPTLAQIIHVMLASMIGLSFLGESAQSQPFATPTQAPTPATTETPTPATAETPTTKNPLLQPPPAPIPTRDPNTPIYRKPITDGTSIDINPDKKPAAAVEIQGPGKATTRIGPDYIPPKQGGSSNPGKGGPETPKEGGAGVRINVEF